MFENDYVSEKFAYALANRVLDGDVDKAIKCCKEAGMLDGFYESFGLALGAMGITTPKDAYKLAMRNPDEVNPDDRLFRVEDGVLSSGSDLLDFYDKGALIETLAENILNGFYGHDNWVLNKYASCSWVDEGNLLGFLCAVGNMRYGTIETLKKLMQDPNYDDVDELFEDLGYAYIKGQYLLP